MIQMIMTMNSKLFLQNNCPGYDLDELRNDIENMKIENIVKNTSYKTPSLI